MPSNYKNPLPNCVFMKLHCEPIISSVQSGYSNLLLKPASKIVPRLKPSKIEKVGLKLTLRFGEYQNIFRDRKIAFGLRGGKLRLKLTDAKMSLESIQIPDFLSSIPIEKQDEISQETEGGLEVKLTGGVIGKRKSVIKTVKKYQNTLGKVYSQGTEIEPIWQFTTDSNDMILRGMVQEQTLGIIEITHESCRIEAFF